MKLLLVAGACLLVSAAASGQVPSPSLCPDTFGVATGGCNEMISINTDGTFSVFAGSGTTYDGSDDALVGIINYSSTPVSSIFLNGNGSDIFGFDGDGIDTFGAPGNPMDDSGYGGPDTYFTNISSDFTSGDVNFVTPLAGMGGTTYFSLEEAFNANNPPTPGGGATPEPGSLVLLGTGVLGVAGMIRRRLGH
jgi:PEP-CTERM motif